MHTKRIYLFIAALVLLWPLLAGLDGYTVGSPPGAFSAGAAPCYHVMRADFLVPMWKAAAAADCPSSSTP